MRRIPVLSVLLLILVATFTIAAAAGPQFRVPRLPRKIPTEVPRIDHLPSLDASTTRAANASGESLSIGDWMPADDDGLAAPGRNRPRSIASEGKGRARSGHTGSASRTTAAARVSAVPASTTIARTISPASGTASIMPTPWPA